jgi:hypothetical protein
MMTSELQQVTSMSHLRHRLPLRHRPCLLTRTTTTMTPMAIWMKTNMVTATQKRRTAYNLEASRT